MRASLGLEERAEGTGACCDDAGAGDAGADGVAGNGVDRARAA